MSFFFFSPKSEPLKEYSLSDIPIFSSLNAPALRSIEKKLRLVQYKRGDIVYKEGTPPDAFYVVVSGRFRLFASSRHNPLGETLLFCYRGDHFGEASLLTGNMHSATVEAKSDGMILQISKEDFLAILSDFPSISHYLNRSLGHRLTRSEEEGKRREVKIGALLSTVWPDEMFTFWTSFAQQLFKETRKKVILVDFAAVVHPDPSQQKNGDGYVFDVLKMDPAKELHAKLSRSNPDDFIYLLASVNGHSDSEVEKKISHFLTYLTYRYDTILIRLPKAAEHPSFYCLKKSDRIYTYTGSEKNRLEDFSKTLHNLVREYGFGVTDVRVLAPEVLGKQITSEEIEKKIGFRIKFIPDKSHQAGYDKSVRFLAREWAGNLVGLALGSGAAYGLSHIGVLRILERENIPIDVVSGSSIGALVGGLWAAGFCADELEKIAKSIDKKNAFFKLIGFRDLSVAHHGFFKGYQVEKYLKGYLGDMTFHDLKIPLQVIAADVFTSEEVVLETGSVASAIRASISIPGIFRPYFYRGNYLIDGGVVDPLPIRTLTQIGVKKIISVNVLPGPQDRIETNRLIEEEKQARQALLAERPLWGRIVPEALEKLQRRYLLNVFNVIMKTIQFMEYEMASMWSQKADISIHPVVYRSHWAQFYAPDPFIRVGEAKTLEQISEIKRLISE